MKTFDSHAAQLLQERVEELEGMDHHSWRCVYMRLHDKQARFNAMLRANFINRAIVDLMARDEGYIYFCDDGDIFIIFEGALKPVVARLAGHFADLDETAGNGLFQFYDLGKEWDDFASLCHGKSAINLPLRDRLPHAPLHDPRRADRVSA